MSSIRTGSVSLALLSSLLLGACVQGQTSNLAALVPPEAVTNEQAASPSQTVDTPSELAAAERAAEQAVERTAAVEADGAATAFAAADDAAKRPAPEAVAETVEEPEAAPGKTKSVFAAWLETNENAKKKATANRREAQERMARLRQESRARSKEKARAAKASQDAAKPRRARATDSGDLPGVRLSSLFGISDVDGPSVRERAGSRSRGGKRPPVVMANVAARARGPGGALLRQHAEVSVNCLKPSLVKMIRRAERHFGRRAVVTSGYRSPRHNRRVRGARRSLHMSCAAADIQIKGVSKWDLASYFRTVPGRGGVGTYCHTRSVHIDIGGKRDWNWRCRRSKRKRRRS